MDQSNYRVPRCLPLPCRKVPRIEWPSVAPFVFSVIRRHVIVTDALGVRSEHCIKLTPIFRARHTQVFQGILSWRQFCHTLSFAVSAIAQTFSPLLFLCRNDSRGVTPMMGIDVILVNTVHVVSHHIMFFARLHFVGNFNV